jgi:glycine/D-amino acid oxidase-like deaminating enzyme
MPHTNDKNTHSADGTRDDDLETTEGTLATRRQFLGLAGAAGLSLLLGGVTGCSLESGAAGTPITQVTAGADSEAMPILQSPTETTTLPVTGPEATAYRPPTAIRPAVEAPTITVTADVCVVGGGAAGMSAATVAAQLGARTVLLEESSVLGGNVTRGLVSMDRVAWGGDLMVAGWFADLIRALAARGDAVFPGEATRFITPCDPDALRTVVLALAHEAGVDVRFGSKVVWAEVSGREITSVWAREQGSLVEVAAPLFIDCTGDGNLGHMAGSSFWLGDRKSGSIQGQTLIFCAAPVNFRRLAAHVTAEGELAEPYRLVGLRSFMGKLRRSGEVEGSPQGGLLIDRNMWNGIVSISGSETHGDHLQPGGLSKIVAQLERQNRQIHRALRKHVPGFEGSRIVRTAERPYLREGRRLTGNYQLSLQDIEKARKPEDSIARGYYPIDLHRDGEVGIIQAVYLRPGDWYGIPYRCIVARDLDNLLMAGRCISVTHEALGSTRISPVSMALGQAAGIAAALCSRQSVQPAALPAADIRAELTRQGALI